MCGGVAVTPDGKRVVSSLDDATVRIWSFADGGVRWCGSSKGVQRLAASSETAVDADADAALQRVAAQAQADTHRPLRQAATQAEARQTRCPAAGFGTGRGGQTSCPAAGVGTGRGGDVRAAQMQATALWPRRISRRRFRRQRLRLRRISRQRFSGGSG